ncbi:MAG: ATP-binding protein [Gemmatimonadota bacterium]
MSRELDGVSAGVQRALDALAMPALMVDPRGAAHLWNDAASRAFGWPRSHTRAHGGPHPFTRSDTTWFARLRRRADEHAAPVGVTLRRTGDRERWVRCTAAPLHLPGIGGGYLLTLRNITSRRLGARQQGLDREDMKDTAAQLRQAQKMEAIGRLAGGIAHDFNNLITAMRGHAQFLVEDLAEDDPSRTDAIEIRHAADRAAKLTRQLLAFGRRQDVEPEEIDLNLVIREMAGLLRRVIREDIHLELELQEDVWPVRMDASHIEQVLMNLVVNARDALPEGGSIRVRTCNVTDDGLVSAGERPLGPCAAVEVEDDGLGMAEATRERMFEPFFTTKPEGEGTGLGLSTVYGIVRQTGGRVAVESRPGKGTLLRVLLPRHP